MSLHLISVAPMLDHTDRFQRYFMRLITKKTLLYTEMIHANAILHGHQKKLLDFHPKESPLAIQLGGNDPKTLAKAAQLAESWGYNEVNFNVGCPSDRVQAGQFGACLMAKPEQVAECLSAMQAKLSIPVTLKCRIGIDKQDSYDFLKRFVEFLIKHSPCRIFIIHARSAWLNGLNPKENRSLPPLRYEYVYRLKQEYPQLTIVINGGIETLEQIQSHLDHVDGVMLGRKAIRDPYFFSRVDHDLYGGLEPIPTRQEILINYIEFVHLTFAQGLTESRSLAIRPLLGLFHGEPQAKTLRRTLTVSSVLEIFNKRQEIARFN